MQKQIKENHMITGHFVFFLINAAQTGVGILSFQSFIAQDAGQDAWISIILVGVSLHFVMWMIYRMLNHPAKDVIDLHRHMFGSFLGNAFSLLLVGYFFLLALDVFLSYIEIIQIWVFPTLETWVLAVILVCISYYLVSGGFRILTGFSFLGVVLSTSLLFALYFPFQHGNLNNLLPFLNHTYPDLIKATKASSHIFTGFVTLLIYFPFLKSPEKTAKWAHYGLVLTTVKHLILTLVTLLYFNQGLLKHTIWPTLVMAKIIEFSFIARFEYIFIFLWLMVIIPALCIPIWCCTRILKKVTTFKPRLFLILILLAISIITLMFREQTEIFAYNKFVSNLGFYFVYGYIPLLFIIYVFRTKFWQKRIT